MWTAKQGLLHLTGLNKNVILLNFIKCSKVKALKTSKMVTKILFYP